MGYRGSSYIRIGVEYPLQVSFTQSHGSPILSSLSLSRPPFPAGDDRASGGVTRHVYAGPFAGDEPRKGMPAPSPPFLLRVAERPKP